MKLSSNTEYNLEANYLNTLSLCGYLDDPIINSSVSKEDMVEGLVKLKEKISNTLENELELYTYASKSIFNLKGFTGLLDETNFDNFLNKFYIKDTFSKLDPERAFQYITSISLILIRKLIQYKIENNAFNKEGNYKKILVNQTEILSKLVILEQFTKSMTIGKNDPKEEIFDVKECAEFLSLSVATIYTKVSKGELPFMKRGKRLHFSKQDLLDYLSNVSKK